MKIGSQKLSKYCHGNRKNILKSMIVRIIIVINSIAFGSKRWCRIKDMGSKMKTEERYVK